MSNRRQLGLWITLAAFVVAVAVMFAGVLFPPVGPPVPPTRIVATTQTGNTFTTTVVAHHQPRTVRWAVAVPLCAFAAAGVLLLLIPPKSRLGS